MAKFNQLEPLSLVEMLSVSMVREVGTALLRNLRALHLRVDLDLNFVEICLPSIDMHRGHLTQITLRDHTQRERKIRASKGSPRHTTHVRIHMIEKCNLWITAKAGQEIHNACKPKNVAI
jgi:hypothetical protein